MDPDENTQPTGGGTPPPPPAPVQQSFPLGQQQAPPPPQPPPATLGRGGQPMSDEAISARVERERKRLLKEEYGTDDAEKIAEIKRQRAEAAEAARLQGEELTRYKQAEEEKKRSEMSELERVRADLVTANEKITRLEGELASAQQNVLAEKQDAIITTIATKHLDAETPGVLDVARAALGKYFKALDDREKKRFDQRAMERWFAKYAKDHPKLAKPKEEQVATKTELTDEEKVAAAQAGAGGNGAPQTQQRQAAAPPRRLMLGQRPGTARTQARPAAKDAPGVVGGLTVRPGQKNSMTKQQLNAHLRSTGRKPW